MAGSTDRDGSARGEAGVNAADDEPPTQGTAGQPAGERADEEADDRLPPPRGRQPTGAASGRLDLSDEVPTAKADDPPLQDTFRAGVEVRPDGARLDFEAVSRDGSRSAATFLGLLFGALAAALLTNLSCRLWAASGYVALVLTLGVFFTVLAAGARFVRAPGHPTPAGRLGRGRRRTEDGSTRPADRERGA